MVFRSPMFMESPTAFSCSEIVNPARKIARVGCQGSKPTQSKLDLAFKFVSDGLAGYNFRLMRECLKHGQGISSLLLRRQINFPNLTELLMFFDCCTAQYSVKIQVC